MVVKNCRHNPTTTLGYQDPCKQAKLDLLKHTLFYPLEQRLASQGFLGSRLGESSSAIHKNIYHRLSRAKENKKKIRSALGPDPLDTLHLANISRNLRSKVDFRLNQHNNMGLVMSFAKGVVASFGFCFCSAVGSLFSSCLGNDKPSTIPPSATSGRRRSVFLLILSIGLAFAFQYGIAPALQPGGSTAADLPISGDYLTDAWTNGCEGYETDELREKCSGNSGVFRVAGSTTLFFLLAGLSAYCKPTSNREAWPAKYFLFLCFVAGTIFIPNDPLFDPIYMQLARAGGVIFIFFQQIILIDLAYNWNESWVGKADKAELEEGTDQGRKWLAAILVSCAILYIGSIVVIVLLYVYFSGCASNEAFISVTIAMSVIVTAVQLSGEESSLLTSAVIVSYSTYLCYTAVSRNPSDECNPHLGDEDVLGIVLGIGLSLLSLAWTGWSFTAHSRVEGRSNPLSENSVDSEDIGEPTKEVQETAVKGVVANQTDYGTGDLEDGTSSPGQTGSSPSEGFSNSWKLNFILALVSCWYAMALTGWGAIETGGNAANPDVGKASMWMIIASQWLVLTLYLWTLAAPRLFPDRDFS